MGGRSLAASIGRVRERRQQQRYVVVLRCSRLERNLHKGIDRVGDAMRRKVRSGLERQLIQAGLERWRHLARRHTTIRVGCDGRERLPSTSDGSCDLTSESHLQIGGRSTESSVESVRAQ